MTAIAPRNDFDDQAAEIFLLCDLFSRTFLFCVSLFAAVSTEASVSAQSTATPQEGHNTSFRVKAEPHCVQTILGFIPAIMQRPSSNFHLLLVSFLSIL